MKVLTVLKRKMKYYFLRANSFEKANLNDEIIIIIKKIERGISEERSTRKKISRGIGERSVNRGNSKIEFYTSRFPSRFSDRDEKTINK